MKHAAMMTVEDNQKRSAKHRGLVSFFHNLGKNIKKKYLRKIKKRQKK